MEKQTFKKGMAILAKGFPDKIMDYDLMWEYLYDLSDADFLKSISFLVESKYEINKATNMIAVIRNLAMPKNKLAGEAWGEVIKQIGKVGSWGTPVFSDPLIRRAVDCLGWSCLCSSEDIMVERAHFLKIYESIVERNKMDLISNSPQILNITKEVVKNLEAGNR